MNDIFVSYRRDDSATIVDRIIGRLKSRFGKKAIFRDIDSIELGADFPSVIDRALNECKVFLAIVGEDWLESTADGRRRLDDPEDYVRFEIATALRRDELMVIPVRVKNAELPDAMDLPDDLQLLVTRTQRACEMTQTSKRTLLVCVTRSTSA